MIKNYPWINMIPEETPALIDPVFGKVYTVSGYDPIPILGCWFLYLEEMGSTGDSWDQRLFAPVVSDTVIAEELSEIFSLEVRK